MKFLKMNKRIKESNLFEEFREYLLKKPLKNEQKPANNSQHMFEEEDAEIDEQNLLLFNKKPDSLKQTIEICKDKNIPGTKSLKN